MFTNAKMFTKMLSLFILIGFSISAVVLGAAATWINWNKHGAFKLTAWDSGVQQNTCYIAAPWNDPVSGKKSWGVEAFTFSDPADHTIEEARFAVFDQPLAQRHAYLYAKDATSRWGVARFVQGKIWTGYGSYCRPAECPPEEIPILRRSDMMGNNLPAPQLQIREDDPCAEVPWHIPTLLRVKNRKLQVLVDYYADTQSLLAPDDSWLLFAINIYFTSPQFPDATPPDPQDVLGKKPLVMDLVVDHLCNDVDGCELGHFEDEAAFHFQKLIGPESENQARCEDRPDWRCYTINLRPLMHEALAHEWDTSGILDAQVAKLQVRELAFVIEVKNAQGAASIDRLRLRHR